MAYSGPANHADLGMDVAYRVDDEDQHVEHWPPLPSCLRLHTYTMFTLQHTYTFLAKHLLLPSLVNVTVP